MLAVAVLPEEAPSDAADPGGDEQSEPERRKRLCRLEFDATVTVLEDADVDQVHGGALHDNGQPSSLQVRNGDASHTPRTRFR